MPWLFFFPGTFRVAISPHLENSLQRTSSVQVKERPPTRTISLLPEEEAELLPCVLAASASTSAFTSSAAAPDSFGLFFFGASPSACSSAVAITSSVARFLFFFSSFLFLLA